MISVRALRAGALALVLASVPATAQAETLKQAMASAYANNPQILSALLDIKSTAEGIALAKSGLRPNIGMGLGAEGDFKGGGSGGYVTSQSFTIGLSYKQTLFDNYKTDAQVEQARAATEISKHALRNAEQNVLLNVVQAYMNVIRDQQLVALRAENVEFYQTQVKSADDRLRIGEGTKIDVSQAQARLAQGQAAYQAALANLQTSQASYQRWVGHKPSGLSADFKFGGLMPKSLDRAIDLAETGHPAILMARASIRAAQAGLDVAKATFGPSLTLDGSLGGATTFSSMNPAGSNVGTTGTSGSLRLSLSIPFYAGGALGAQVRKANVGQVKSEVDALSTRDELREAIIKSWASLQAASAQIDAATSALDAGQLALEGVIQERDVGQRTTLDVLNAQSELTTTRENLITARNARIIASFALIAATGRLSPSELGLGVEVKSADGYIAKVEDVWQELYALDD